MKGQDDTCCGAGGLLMILSSRVEQPVLRPLEGETFQKHQTRMKSMKPEIIVACLQVSFAAELEALRKDSASSHKSSTSERTTTIAVDALRKASSVSLDAALRKASTYSDCYYDYNPQESDATP